MARRIKDMTEGKPARLILTFALPLMVGNAFQQAYTIVDSIVVGRIVGVEALAALGASDWLNWMLLGLIVGMTHGFNILVAQRFGAGDHEGLRKTIAMSTILSALIALAMTSLSLVFARPALKLMNTPSNILTDANTYLMIMFSGIPVITAYNMVSSILRAMGDSRTPFYAMVIASLINIFFDIIFVAVFHWGVAGAAIATVIAELFAFYYCWRVVKRLDIIALERKHFIWDSKLVSKLLKIGSPMALQNAIIGAGGLVVQYIINGFGFIYVAGFTATNKLYGLLELAASSFGFSMATFTGQNLGAKKYDRIRKGMKSAISMAIITSTIISILMIIFGRNILGLFISGNPVEVAQVLDIAYKYLFIMATMLFVLYLLHVYRSALQGMGDTMIPMVSGIVELIMRVLVIIFLPILIGERGLYYAEVAAWLGAELILMFFFYYRVSNLSGDLVE